MRSRTIYQCLLITLTTLLVNIQIASAREAIAETVTYYHYDGLGSTIAATDDNGKLLWHEDYLPYGKRFTREDDGHNTLWFTGKPHEDKLGLSYFGARWYSPTIGRFTGIDPVGVDPENVHSFNRYAYANNNPYKYIDPDGESPIDAFFFFADGVKLASAVYNGVGIGAAAADLGASALGLFSPVPGTGQAIKAAKLFQKTTTSGTAVIGRVKDLKNLKKRERSLLDRLPYRGSPKASWKQNSGVLRQEMSNGKPIRDASPGDTRGQFLNAERNLLESRDWTFDKGSNYWNPPG